MLHQSVNGALRRRISRDRADRRACDEGRDEDHIRAVSQHWQQLLNEKVGSADIDREQPVEVLFHHLVHPAVDHHPGVTRTILTEDRAGLHRFVNVYVNGQDVRYMAGLDTPVAPADEVRLLPAMAGG